MTARYVVLACAACLAIVAVGCSVEETDPENIVVDSLDADLIVDLHLASARAEVTGEPADSLQNEVLAAHHIDSLALGDLHAEYANQPLEAVALYERALEQLSAEKQGR